MWENIPYMESLGKQLPGTIETLHVLPSASVPSIWKMTQKYPKKSNLLVFSFNILETTEPKAGPAKTLANSSGSWSSIKNPHIYTETVIFHDIPTCEPGFFSAGPNEEVFYQTTKPTPKRGMLQSYWLCISSWVPGHICAIIQQKGLRKGVPMKNPSSKRIPQNPGTYSSYHKQVLEGLGVCAMGMLDIS